MSARLQAIIRSNPAPQAIAAEAVNMPAKQQTGIHAARASPRRQIEEVTLEGSARGARSYRSDDDKDRNLPRPHHLLETRSNGRIGSVSFSQSRVQRHREEKATEDDVMEAAIEAGAEDVSFTDQHHEVQTSPDTFPQVKAKLEERGLPLAVAEISMIPTTEVPLDARKAEQTMKLMEALEDHDDVQNVWANFDFEEGQVATEEKGSG